MKQSLLIKSSAIGILVTFLLGFAWHFLYEWSGRLPLVAFLAPVSESPWEHTKLLIFPMLLYLSGESFFLSKALPFGIIAGIWGMLPGVILIPGLFYLYFSFMGKAILPLDIGIFAICVLLAFFLRYRLLRTHTFTQKEVYVSRTLLIFLLLFYVLFTWKPPLMPPFVQP